MGSVTLIFPLNQMDADDDNQARKPEKSSGDELFEQGRNRLVDSRQTQEQL